MAHSKTFYMQDGKVFSSLEKFAKELQTMADDVFKHHVNDEKHDFREWIKHSLKEEQLANKIDAKIDKLELELEVLRHLVHEQKAQKKVVKKETKKVETPKKEVKKVTPEKKTKTTKTKSAKK
ncbi:MAG: DUF5752 family protein [Nanoarchaeota archaeon]|nr:DUF5752 family protein [Nanoarchaeota archaeon]